MKKLFSFLLPIVIVFTILPSYAIAQIDEPWLDTDKIDQGVIGIQYSASSEKQVKLLIDNSGKRYSYDLQQSDEKQFFPLQSGDGDYQITLLEQVKGNQYRVLHRTSIQAKMLNQQEVFLQSIQLIAWDEDAEAVVLAKELTADMKTDEEKVKSIYQYIIENIQYDYDLASEIESGYIPDIDDTLLSGKAICFGYSTLFAAMLRSIDIPTKLNMGTTEYLTEYHAWNEVYIDDEWITVDLTVDHAYTIRHKSIEWKKNSDKYETQKMY